MSNKVDNAIKGMYLGDSHATEIVNRILNGEDNVVKHKCECVKFDKDWDRKFGSILMSKAYMFNSVTTDYSPYGHTHYININNNGTYTYMFTNDKKIIEVVLAYAELVYNYDKSVKLKTKEAVMSSVTVTIGKFMRNTITRCKNAWRNKDKLTDSSELVKILYIIHDNVDKHKYQTENYEIIMSAIGEIWKLGIEKEYGTQHRAEDSLSKSKTVASLDKNEIVECIKAATKKYIKEIEVGLVMK